MRYRDFIAETRNLIEEAERIKQSKANHENPEFRGWRHRSESLVNEAEALGYRLPGKFRSSIRVYRALWGGASAKDDRAAFAKEVSDSIIELRHFVDQYEKYGEPKSVQVVADGASQLLAPERVTLAWLFKNVTVGLWFAGLGLLGGAFIVGVAVARTDAYISLEKWIKTVWAAL